MDTQDLISWGPLVLVFLLVIFAIIPSGRRRRAPEGHVPWFRAPSGRPAIYLIRSAHDARLVKVGYTGRRVETRMSEIAADRGRVILLFSLRMPHAYAAEQAAHRALRGARGVRHAGGEWYVADPRRVRRIVLSAANSTRRKARLRFSWPPGGKIFVWKDLP